MKAFVGLVVALAAGMSSALAQTPPAPSNAPPTTPSVAAPPSHCADVAPAPTADILHATQQQVRAANDAMAAWATESRARIQCRGAEVQLLVAQTRAAQAALNDEVAQFTATAEAWNAQTAALDAQRHNQRR